MNIYYNPERFGLKIVDAVEYGSGCYEFDLLVVWEDEAGQLYYAEDTGCSCPMEFENTGRDDLIPATKIEVVEKAQAMLASRLRLSWGDDEYGAGQRVAA